MKYASIDIGTNTVRLLIASRASDGRLKPLLYDRMITRLGGDYDELTGLSPASAARTLDCLARFGRLISEHGATLVSAVATSVVRRAANRDLFLKELKERTGIEARVIDGYEEAGLALAGVRTVLADSVSEFLLMDIGGGSTEFVAARGALVDGSWSMEMGVVHLAERHLESDPPTKEEIASLEAEVAGVVTELKQRMIEDCFDPSVLTQGRGAVLVGTAGTTTTLAALDQHLDVYDREKINNYVMKDEDVRRMYDQLSAMELREREAVLTLEKGREDIIVPGCAIILQVMATFGFDSALVSDAGLLEGIIIDHLGHKADPLDEDR